MIPSKWALTVDSDMLVYVTLCVCISAREKGAGFPFPSKEKSSWGAVLVLNKSQIRSKKEREREEGREKEEEKKLPRTEWLTDPNPLSISLLSLSESSNLFFSSPPSQLPELGMSLRSHPPRPPLTRPPSLPPHSPPSLPLSLLSPNPPPRRPSPSFFLETGSFLPRLLILTRPDRNARSFLKTRFLWARSHDCQENDEPKWTHSDPMFKTSN